jgi:hypothetical protein
MAENGTCATRPGAAWSGWLGLKNIRGGWRRTAESRGGFWNRLQRELTLRGSQRPSAPLRATIYPTAPTAPGLAPHRRTVAAGRIFMVGRAEACPGEGRGPRYARSKPSDWRLGRLDDDISAVGRGFASARLPGKAAPRSPWSSARPPRESKLNRNAQAPPGCPVRPETRVSQVVTELRPRGCLVAASGIRGSIQCSDSPAPIAYESRINIRRSHATPGRPKSNTAKTGASEQNRFCVRAITPGFCDDSSQVSTTRTPIAAHAWRSGRSSFSVERSCQSPPNEFRAEHQQRSKEPFSKCPRFHPRAQPASQQHADQCRQQREQ